MSLKKGYTCELRLTTHSEQVLHVAARSFERHGLHKAACAIRPTTLTLISKFLLVGSFLVLQCYLLQEGVAV